MSVSLATLVFVTFGGSAVPIPKKERVLLPADAQALANRLRSLRDRTSPNDTEATIRWERLLQSNDTASHGEVHSVGPSNNGVPMFCPFVKHKDGTAEACSSAS